MQTSRLVPSLLLLFIASVPLAFASDVRTITRIIKEDGAVCGKNSAYTKATGENCSVKKVRFESQNYSIKDPEDVLPFYGTLGYFGFETNSWADITKYGFVQRIRGCTYHAKKNADGSVSKRIGESIMHLDVKRIYVFPEWSNDATTTDPLYYGPTEEDAHLNGGRVSLYRWTPQLGVINSKKTKDLYEMLQMPASKRKKLSPSVFVTDSPSMAYMISEADQTFQNVSLEFRICLYKLKDIPLAVDSEAPIDATPIVCHNWNSQFEYNFEKNKYEHKPKKGLDSFCATQEPLNPAEVFRREQEAKAALTNDSFNGL